MILLVHPGKQNKDVLSLPLSLVSSLTPHFQVGFYPKINFIFNYVHIYVRICAHEFRSPLRSKEGVKSPLGAGDPGGREPPRWGPDESSAGLRTAEPSLQPRLKAFNPQGVSQALDSQSCYDTYHVRAFVHLHT